MGFSLPFSKNINRKGQEGTLRNALSQIASYARYIVWSSLGARTKNQEPRAKSQEPKAKSQKPKAKSQKPKAYSCPSFVFLRVLCG
jgi:hypothetical protein